MATLTATAMVIVWEMVSMHIRSIKYRADDPSHVWRLASHVIANLLRHLGVSTSKLIVIETVIPQNK